MALRNGHDQLIAYHIPWVLKPFRQNSIRQLYDRLSADTYPGAGDKNILQGLNPVNLKLMPAHPAPSMVRAQPDQKLQFQQYGYFLATRLDHVTWSKQVFNRAAGLKGGWGK